MEVVSVVVHMTSLKEQGSTLRLLQDYNFGYHSNKPFNLCKGGSKVKGNAYSITGREGLERE